MDTNVEVLDRNLAAVKITNGFKVFTEKSGLFRNTFDINVLKNFNMNVPPCSM